MRLGARLYLLSWKIGWRLPAFLRSVHSSLWLLLLSPEALNDLTMRSYAGATGFETEEHNLGGLWEWEEAALREHFSGCKSILVCGAGGGREMVALARMGFEVDGFDASPELVEACRRNLDAAGAAAGIWLASPGEVPGDAGVYDGLFVGRGVYHHIPERGRRIAFLNACRLHIKAGSPALIGDFLTRSEEPRQKRTPERGDILNNAFFHLFTRQEIELECAEAGFDLIAYGAVPLPGFGELAYAIARVANGPTRHVKAAFERTEAEADAPN